MQAGKLFLFYRIGFHIVVVLVLTVAMPMVIMPMFRQQVNVARPAPPPGRAIPLPPPQIRPLPEGFQIRFVAQTIAIIPFYFLNAFVLVPAFLVKRRYSIFTLCIGLGLVLTMVFSQGIHLMFEDRMPGNFFGTVIPLLMLLGVGTSFELIVYWEQQRRKQDLIEKEKIAAELSYLKMQVDPHFLFNSLNNIYSLSEQKSENTSRSIMLLADLMKYMLYETNNGRIPLVKEVKHIEDYIALQQMRIPSKEDVQIDFNKEGDLLNVEVEPLLFIPFIENAFKHGVSYGNRSFIQIDLTTANNITTLKILNSKHPGVVKQDKLKHGGIGIANTIRRLDLLYPDQYILRFYDEQTYYITYLQLRGK